MIYRYYYNPTTGDVFSMATISDSRFDFVVNISEDYIDLDQFYNIDLYDLDLKTMTMVPTTWQPPARPGSILNQSS